MATDPHVAALARLFLEHPAWISAARHVRDDATSSVRFSHLPDEVFRLERKGGKTLLRKGRAEDPDFAFCFTPAAIDRLAATSGDEGDFAVALFSLVVETDPALRVGLRVCAPFPRLVWRGYLRLLLASGPKVIRFGARHGVATLSALRRLVAEQRSRGPEDWER